MLRSILLMAVLIAGTDSVVQAWPISFPTGTTLYDPKKAYNGYTLFAPMGEDNYKLYLINMSGQAVHEWKLRHRVIYGRLLPNGNLVVIAHNPRVVDGRPGIAPFRIGGVAGILFEMTWDGRVIFQHEDLNMHHDALKLANGNYLYLAWERVPKEQQAKIRGGIKHTEFRNFLRSQPELTVEEFKRLDRVMFSDVLIEINPQRKAVWKWHAKDHLDPDVDIIGPAYPREEWGHTNTINVLENGNLLLTSRLLDSMIVVNKQSGDVVFRWGNATRLNDAGETEPVGLPTFPPRSGPNLTMGGPHGAEQVPPGLPGAGNFTCYDNGFSAIGPLRTSRAVEVDPKTGTIVWESIKYDHGMPSPIGRKHFSEILGSAQRLPNGNMLFCEGVNGRLFQLTKDHEEVWEYVNPFIDATRFNGAILKAYCYPPDYCPHFKSLLPAVGTNGIVLASDAHSRVGQVDVGWPTKWLVAVGAAAAVLAATATFAIGLWRGRSEAIIAAESARPAKRQRRR